MRSLNWSKRRSKVFVLSPSVAFLSSIWIRKDLHKTIKFIALIFAIAAARTQSMEFVTIALFAKTTTYVNPVRQRTYTISTRCSRLEILARLQPEFNASTVFRVRLRSSKIIFHKMDSKTLNSQKIRKQSDIKAAS